MQIKAKTFVAECCGNNFKNLLFSLGLKAENITGDIAVIGENAENTKSISEIMFCPENPKNIGGKCRYAVSAGMGSKATLGFSSINEKNALLYINREIDFFGRRIEEGEYKVELKSGISLYENMIYGFLAEFL